ALLGRRDHLVVEPAKEELLPRAEVGAARADRLVVRSGLAALRHHRPPVDAVVRARNRVVEVGQAEVVAVLVREDRHAAVLGLDRVVTDPEAGVSDLGAAEQVSGRARGAGVVVEGEPTGGPNAALARR